MAAERPLKKGATGNPRQFNLSIDLVAAKGLDVEGLGTHVIDRVGDDLRLSDPENGVQTLSKLRDRRLISQTGHGFSIPSFGFLPVYWNATAGAFQPANADDVNTACDCVVVKIEDANSFWIQEGGLLELNHGLTVGEWYALRSGLAGLILPADDLDGLNKQFLCFVPDANSLILRIDPIVQDNTFVPQDIVILENWTQGGSPTVATAGDDRILLVGVAWEDQAGSTLVTGMTVGGEAGTLVTEQSIISGIQAGAALYYWTEAQLQAMSGNALVISWSAGAPSFFQTFDALIEHVDQTTPFNAVNTDQGTGGTDTLDADVNTLSGGYAVAIAAGGNGGMGFTNNGAGWTRRLDLTITSADGVVDDKLIVTPATPENVNMGITGSNRHVMLAAAFQRRES